MGDDAAAAAPAGASEGKGRRRGKGAASGSRGGGAGGGRADADGHWRAAGEASQEGGGAAAAEGRRSEGGRAGRAQRAGGPQGRGSRGARWEPAGAAEGQGGGAPGRPAEAGPDPADQSAAGARQRGKGKGRGGQERGAAPADGQGGAREHHGGRKGAGSSGAAADPPDSGGGEAAPARGGPRSGRGRGSGAGRGKAGGASPKTVTGRLTEQIGRGSHDCMICLGGVARQQPIWQCDQCWCIIHLKCIHQWIKKLSESGGGDRAWTCPNCRYHRVSPLPRYKCFCQKVVEPEASPHWLAHSCGEVCGRDRGCPHACPELCHPGPCPPCTAVGSAGQCHCGREQRERMRCGDPARWSCGEVCGRQLSCGVHTCPLRCHPGPCPPCKVAALQRCHCGAEQRERTCGQAAFACAGVCGRALSCGNHVCERTCHPGDCGLCPRDPASVGDRCACGSTERCSGEAQAALLVRWVGVRTKCTDPLPLCGRPCGRPRERCSHVCRRSCHEGPCGPCDEIVEKDCRCGQTRRGVVCSEQGEFLCGNVCRAKKTCGKHRCDVICCPGHNMRNHENHMCLQVCGKPLACGIHVCEEFCHLGRCPPCRVYRHEPLTCACGEESIAPPVPCGTEPPYCNQTCGAELDCGHTCLARCHFGEHPPCRELVVRMCRGGHREMPNQPCHVGPISCGRTCGRDLPCGHTCAAQCHAGDCPPCTQPCNKRRVHCDHTCEADCHPGSPCEDTPCRRKVKLACECGLRVTEQVCGAYSGNPRPQLLAPRCDHNCERPAEARRPGARGVAAWGAGAPRAAEEQPVRFAPDLHGLACGHLKYVLMLEDKFLSLVAAATGTPAAAPVVLPPCDATRRLLATEYARLHWKLRTSSRSDATEGWWQLRVEQTKGMRPPRPLLSEAARVGSAQASRDGHLLPALDLRPRLCFSGASGAGDEVYDAVGPEGLLAVRPGQKAGEVFAFFDREATAEKAFRRLTGQPPGQEAVSVTTGGSACTGLRVLLAQTLSGRGAPAAKAPAARAAGPAAAAGRGDGSSSSTAAGPGAARAAAEPVLDSWEDASDD